MFTAFNNILTAGTTPKASVTLSTS